MLSEGVLKPASNQLAFDLFEQPKQQDPRDCPRALKTVDIGGGKTFCESMGMWTNCLEVNHCVYAACKAS